ncbi:hypothetical protein V1509DRAFT_624552 [Lipomyces kononenkoae]
MTIRPLVIDRHNLSTEVRLLQKIQGQSKDISDIDRYFDDGIIGLANTKANENWLFEWWNAPKGEYPQWQGLLEISYRCHHLKLLRATLQQW